MRLVEAKKLVDSLHEAEYVLQDCHVDTPGSLAVQQARNEIIRARADMMVILQELRTAEQYLKNGDLEKLEFALGVIYDVAHRAVSGDRL